MVPLVIALTTATALMMLLDAPPVVRVPIVVAFLLFAPGTAIVRFVPVADGFEFVALVCAASISIVVLVSQALVYLEVWSGPAALALLGFVALTAAVPGRRSRIHS